MKSLISGTLILLALYAQASCAQDAQARLIILNSQIQSFSAQVTRVQPTLLVPLNHSQYGIMAFTRIDRQQSATLQDIQASHMSEAYGIGMLHQVNSWMYTQVVVQTQQLSNLENGYESVVSLTAQF